jgi:hypothetical protein
MVIKHNLIFCQYVFFRISDTKSYLKSMTWCSGVEGCDRRQSGMTFSYCLHICIECQNKSGDVYLYVVHIFS